MSNTPLKSDKERLEIKLNLHYVHTLYDNLLRDIVTRIHNGYPQKLIRNTDEGMLNASVAHIKACHKCQGLLKYLTNELKKILPEKRGI